MNRLPASFRSTSLPFSRRFRTLPHNKETLRAFRQVSFPFLQFIPENYEPNYDYPLILWLHSDASSEQELPEVMSALSSKNFVALSPRAPHASAKKGNYFEWNMTESGVMLASEMIEESIALACDQYSIHPGRIFLAGYGKGGTMAQAVGLQNPGRFGGIVSINGPFPKVRRLLSRWKEAKSLPILWMHGNQSRQCGMNAMCSMLRTAFVSALSVHPVQFHGGDILTTDLLVKVNRFLMQIVTNQPIELCESLPVE